MSFSPSRAARHGRLRPLAGYPLDRCAATFLFGTGNNACTHKTACRTAGALMMGNAVVAVLILNNRYWLGVAALLILGLAVIIVASIDRKE